MLGGVFISYRREDSGGFAGRIYDRLTTRLGRDGVFFDVDNIPPGLDFVDVLSERVGGCDALVAIIGRAWNPVSDKNHRPRLEDPNDFVRVEIEAALARGIRVIPVLVDGAAMPRAEDLPDGLKKLTRRQGIEISHTRFDSDVERLTRALSALEDELRQREPSKGEERAARVEREKREAAADAQREKLAAEAAERARQHAATEARRRDEERRALEAAEAESADSEERDPRAALEQEALRQLPAEAEAIRAVRRAEAMAKSPVGVGRGLLESPEAEEPNTASAGTARRRGVRNWSILAAVVGAAILMVVLLVAESRLRPENAPAVEPNAAAPSPSNPVVVAPPVAPKPETAAQPKTTAVPPPASNTVAVTPPVAPKPETAVQPETTAAPAPASNSAAVAPAVAPKPETAAQPETAAAPAPPSNSVAVAPPVASKPEAGAQPETTAASAPATHPAAAAPPVGSKPQEAAAASPPAASPESPKTGPENPVQPKTDASDLAQSSPTKPVPAKPIEVGTLSQTVERALPAKDVFKECADCPDMVVVPPGEYAMGSSASDIENGVGAANEGPQHRVLINRRFALARYEVTRDQFEAFVAASHYSISDRCRTLENSIPEERADRSFRNPGFEQTGAHPAVCVNWLDAMAYADWLSRKTGKTYRLPTEAEYEYAARAGGTSRWGFGDDASSSCKFVNGADQSAKRARLPGDPDYLDCSDGYVYTAPVGSFQANAFGLYDLQGNVWEWTADCYRDDYVEASSDGSDPATDLCVARTVRGGSWSSTAPFLRPAVRAKAVINDRYDDVGFRVMRELEP